MASRALLFLCDMLPSSVQPHQRLSKVVFFLFRKVIYNLFLVVSSSVCVSSWFFFFILGEMFSPLTRQTSASSQPAFEEIQAHLLQQTCTQAGKL